MNVIKTIKNKNKLIKELIQNGFKIVKDKDPHVLTDSLDLVEYQEYDIYQKNLNWKWWNFLYDEPEFFLASIGFNEYKNFYFIEIERNIENKKFVEIVKKHVR